MGRLVEQLAPEHGCEIAGVITRTSGARAIAEGAFGHVDVAVDFSLADAVPGSLSQLAAKGINVVIGATGWQAHDAAMRQVADRTGIGVIAAANFALGMNLFRLIVADAARRFAAQPDYGAWIHELHHAKKKDAPSGTALAIKSAMEHAGFARPIDVSSTRAGAIPGTHIVGFDGPAESITLRHDVRDRAVFAHGALAAAQWIKGRRGWFTIDDMLSSAAGE
jgi:4-hydroxy-tetrahydrodipicolinate reductase